MKDVSVVIVNWNSGTLLEGALRSLEGVQDDVESVRVVDNASDRRPDVPAGCKAELVRLRVNRGFAAGANEGIRRAGGEFVLLLNPDVRVPEQSLRRLAVHARRHPRAAIVCGPLSGDEGHPQTDFQMRRLPSASSVLADALFLDEIAAALRLRRRVWPSEPKGAVEVEQPAAAYWLIRKEAWREVGGFDEDFRPAWFEDVDLCRRLLAAKPPWRILAFPDCPARHAGGYSVSRLGRRRFLRAFYGNLELYLAKHHPRTLPWLRPAIALGLQLRLLALRLRRKD